MQVTREEYVILAYSATLNETQRELNLMSPHYTNRFEAEQAAESFARRLNERNQVQDWVGRTELQTLTVITD